MAKVPGKNFLVNLVERRSLLFQLVRRDFEMRFIGSAAGWLWGLIHPLVLLLSWLFVFQICMKIELPRGAITQNYTFYLFAGFLPWLLFQETVQRSPASMIDQSSLITKTIFPAEIVPVSVFLSALMNHLLALALVMVAVKIKLGQFSLMVLMLPVYMLLLGLFAVGVGWIVSALHVYLRDTGQVVSVMLTLWFWITPIFITEDKYPPKFQFLLRINPMAYLVRAYRELLLSNHPPDWRELATLAGFAVAAFVVGGLFFRHLKRGFADVL
jgi:ABC-type polysaccharide/polyol phosphate export permease